MVLTPPSQHSSYRSANTSSLSSVSPNIKAQFPNITSNEIRTKKKFEKTDKSIYPQIHNNLNIFIFKKNKSLWHGTTANKTTEGAKWLAQIRENAPNALSQPLFLADKRTASLYGTNKDSAKLISIYHNDIHSFENRKNPPTAHASTDIIPLYQIPGVHGINLEFRIKSDLKLLDIGDKDNMEELVKMIKKLNIPKEEKNNNLEILANTCFESERDSETFEFKHIKHCTRTSTEWFDKDLVILLSETLKLNIDGWVYFKDSTPSTFHCEVFLYKPQGLLEYKSTYSVPDTYWPGIPTWEELRNSRPKYNKSYDTIDVKFKTPIYTTDDTRIIWSESKK
jgi:hypothetical protein